MICCPQCGARNFKAEDPGPCDHNGDCECFYVPGKGWVGATPDSTRDEYYRVLALLDLANERHMRVTRDWRERR